MNRDSEPIQIHGPAMRAVRGRAGVTLARIATSAGVSVSFLAQVERGVKRAVRPQVFAAIVTELALADGRALLVNPYAGDVTGDTGSHLESMAHDRLGSSRTTKTRAA